jgi:thiol-disulfide isomerase/thioredoxin
MSLRELTSAKEHTDFIKRHPVALVFYGSKHCPHCVSAVPRVKDLARENKTVHFGHVEVSDVKVQGLEGLPTFMGYVNGEPYDKITGADFQKLSDMLYNINEPSFDDSQ